MIHILESFACGIAFAMGVTSFFFVRDLATTRGRAEILKVIQAHNKRVEDRMAVQVATMAACLAEIQKNKDN